MRAEYGTNGDYNYVLLLNNVHRKPLTAQTGEAGLVHHIDPLIMQWVHHSSMPTVGKQMHATITLMLFQYFQNYSRSHKAHASFSSEQEYSW